MLVCVLPRSVAVWIASYRGKDYLLLGTVPYVYCPISCLVTTGYVVVMSGVRSRYWTSGISVQEDRALSIEIKR